jgi:hypothetical protein
MARASSAQPGKGAAARSRGLRRSVRGRIAPGSQSEPLSDPVCRRDSSRKRPAPAQGESNASEDTSSAVSHSAQEPTVTAGVPAKPESPGLKALKAREDVNESSSPSSLLIAGAGGAGPHRGGFARRALGRGVETAHIVRDLACVLFVEADERGMVPGAMLTRPSCLNSRGS